jgi:hypothetical protein
VAARSPERTLLVCLLAFAAASLLHHVHNAEFLHDYPNLPASLSRGRVYGAWLAEALLGVAGWLLLQRGYPKSGSALIAIYALVGFSGLAHYVLAPASAHSLVMNATIWLEVVMAAVLLAAVVRRSTR